MTPQHTISLFIGAVTGVSTGAMQTAAAQPTMSPLLVPTVSAIVGAIFSYAVLKTTVSVMEKDLMQMRQDLGQVYDLIRESHSRIARIEGRLDERE